MTFTDFSTDTLFVNPTWVLTPSLHLYALAILYTTPAPTTPFSSTSTSQETTTTSTIPVTTTALIPTITPPITSTSTGKSTPTTTVPTSVTVDDLSLDTGKAAGIGVGVTFGVLVVALASCAAFRRWTFSRGGARTTDGAKAAGNGLSVVNPEEKAGPQEIDGTPLNELENTHPKKLHELAA
ncbi:hypothetical protein F4780DRAFT_764681 [Xylariomycetidae sp. FL0641]|nr:hypothetical protein F4780DRAFT_764681 [Xylariomycetidae sp. FL0641]